MVWTIVTGRLPGYILIDGSETMHWWFLIPAVLLGGIIGVAIGYVYRKNVAEAHAFHRVKSRRRLVENDDLRVVHQGIGNADALNHTTGEFLHLFARYVAQAYPFEQLLAAFLCDSGINAVERRHIGEKLRRGIVAVIAEFLRKVADQFTVTAVVCGR